MANALKVRGICSNHRASKIVDKVAAELAHVVNKLKFLCVRQVNGIVHVFEWLKRNERSARIYSLSDAARAVKRF